MSEEGKNNKGRPTKYDESYNDLAYKFCLMGATDKQLAEFLDICEATLYTWKKEYPDFLEAIKDGKHRADAEISQSLFNKARGGYAEVPDPMGEEGDTKTVYIPPDTTSMIFWLKNRQPDKWRDKREEEVTLKNDLTALLDEVDGSSKNVKEAE